MNPTMESKEGFLNETECRRMDELRGREMAGSLMPQEEEELAGLIDRVERAEAAYLVPATQRILDEAQRLSKDNKALRDLIRRKERLVQRLERLLAQANAESDAIDSEARRILADIHSRAVPR